MQNLYKFPFTMSTIHSKVTKHNKRQEKIDTKDSQVIPILELSDLDSKITVVSD